MHRRPPVFPLGVAIAIALVLGVALAGCGGGTKLLPHSSASTVTVGSPSKAGAARAAQTSPALGFPSLATKNTTRVDGADPITDAAGVALAVYPSAAPGTHPGAVTLAPSDDWQAAIAASVLMAPPVDAPVLLSGASSLPAVTSEALAELAPTGSGAVGGAQVIRVGQVPHPRHLRSATITGADPYALAASIDRFVSAVQGKTSVDVVIASATDPAYAMPAAGWAAESGDPVLFVNASGVPAATRQALLAHQSPNIYVLGPASVIPNTVLAQLRRYGKVKRVGAGTPAANSVAFAEYRDPPCPAASAGRFAAPGMATSSRAPSARSTPPRRPLSRAAATTVPRCWSTMPLLSPVPCSTSSSTTRRPATRRRDRRRRSTTTAG
jgi:hypothetical protein